MRGKTLKVPCSFISQPFNSSGGANEYSNKPRRVVQPWNPSTQKAEAERSVPSPSPSTLPYGKQFSLGLEPLSPTWSLLTGCPNLAWKCLKGMWQREKWVVKNFAVMDVSGKLSVERKEGKQVISSNAFTLPAWDSLPVTNDIASVWALMLCRVKKKPYFCCCLKLTN